MNIDDIRIFEKPRKGSVRRAENIMKNWHMQHIPLKELDPQKGLEEAIKDYIMENPEYMGDVQAFNEVAGEYQTIMLATTLSLKDLQKLEDEISADDWDTLVERCKDAIGGDAEDFFNISTSGTSLKMDMTDTATGSESTT